ncbi:hypothetical protein BC832DRAFT_563834 [Gaertneriomyces semiglobifer]|nr:hypothetical protein BC832DRAFT_563834 [Gaertneriomyces semiglobifer]
MNDHRTSSGTINSSRPLSAMSASSASISSPRYAKALYDFPATGMEELLLEEDDIITLTRSSPQNGWLFGMKNGIWGWFPASYVKILTEEECFTEGLEETRGGEEEEGDEKRLSVSRPPARPAPSSDHGAENAAKPATTAAGQRSWANKYKTMPRYSKRTSGTGLEELEAAIGNHIKEALARPKSEVSTPPATLLSSISAGSITEEEKGQKEAPKRIGSLRGKRDLKAMSLGASAGKNIITNIGAMEVKKRWVEVVGDETVKRLGLTKKDIQRQEVIREMFETEKDYVVDLEIIINVYMSKLKAQKILQPKDMSIIFSNVEQLLPVNQQLVKWLEDRISKGPLVEQIGDIFIRVSDFLKMYTMYCRNHPYALMKLQSVRQSKSVAKYLDSLAQLPECRSLNLANYLIKPVQRICKYPLLIRELLKNTEPDHIDFPNLEKAFLKIETVVTIVNEGARQAEAVQRMLELQGRFTTKVNIVAPWRNLLKSGSVELLKPDGNRSRRELFLFNDMVLLSKSLGGSEDTKDQKLKLMDMIPFDVIMVNIPTVGENLIELAHVGNARYMLLFDSISSQSGWIDALKEATKIWMAQKNRQSMGGAPATAMSSTVDSSGPTPDTGPASPGHRQGKEASHVAIPDEISEDEVVVKEDVPDEEGGLGRDALQSFQKSGTGVRMAAPIPDRAQPERSTGTIRQMGGGRQLGGTRDRFGHGSSGREPASQVAASGMEKKAPPLPALPPKVVNVGHNNAATARNDGTAASPLANSNAVISPGRTPPLARPISVRLQSNPFIVAAQQNAFGGPSSSSAKPPSPPKSEAVAASQRDKPQTPTPGSKATSVTSAKEALPVQTRISRSNTASPTSCSVNKPIRRAQVEGVFRPPTRESSTFRSATGKDYVYTVRVFPVGLAADDEGYAIRHTYEDFFDFHMQLIGHFPEEAGVRVKLLQQHQQPEAITDDSGEQHFMPGAWTEGPKRIIPELPGQMMFVSEAAAKGRVGQLQEYIQAILALPLKISRAPVTLQFFRCDGKHAVELLGESSSNSSS